MRAHLLDLNAGRVNRGTAALTGILEAAGYEVERWEVRVAGGIPASDEDLWVLGGGPGSPEEPGAWREPLLGALRGRVAENLPTFAICYGFELLGAAMGGRLARLANPREGVYGLDLSGSDTLLAGLHGERVFERREWGVFGLVPAAHGPEGDVAAVRFAPRVFGTIFHPEADLGAETRAVFDTLLPRFLLDLRSSP